MFDYRKWCREQAAAIESAMRSNAGAHGNSAVWFIPTDGRQAGKLVLATDKPEAATDVIRFPGVGSRISAVPYSHIFGAVYDACRRLPLIPTEGV